MMRISGSGGKSGAGGGGISEDPDSLSGVTRARYIDLIGEGEIVGLVNGESSIYLDGVPLRDLKGTPNYKPFKWKMVNGTASQQPIPGFSGTSSEVGVGVNLTVSAGTIIRSIADGDADAVRVNVSVTGLSLTDSAGKISATSVSYIIRARRSGGSWVDLKTVTITGKTGARYPKSDEVLLTGFAGVGSFEVSVTRITPDSASALLVNGLHWDSFTVINYEQYAYPHSALLALELDARYFSQIPSRSYHVRGLLVRVPDNYDPLTRTYTGVWAGRGFWKLAYTNNPAWCYFDLITNRRYGLGRRISDDQVDVWEIYSIGKYCDEIVPTGGTSNISDIVGTGGVSTGGDVVIGAPIRASSGEPRFTLNCVINTTDDAYRVLNQLSTAFRGMTYWGAAGVAFTQDRPTPVSMLWNNANVVDGRFSYAGSSKSNRHTAVSVAWNDPDEDFRQRFEYVEDRDGITRYGVRSTEVTAFGCTSRSQARRVGLWMLYTERMETDVITFRAGLDSSRVKPGDTGEIMDSKRVGLRWGGRISAATLTSITLDASVTLAVGTYTLAVVAKDGAIVSRSVVIGAAGIYATLTLAVALPAVPADMAMWVLSSTAVSPVTVRVINMKQIDAATFEFAVLRHNPSKFNAIDLGAKLAVPSYTALKRGELPAVTGLVAVENTYRLPTATASRSYLEVSWDHGVVGLVGGVSVVTKDLLTRGYNLVIQRPGSTPFTIQEQSDSTYTYADIEPGTYTVTVRPVSYLGVVGANAATVTRVVTGIDSRPPENVQGLTCTTLTGGPRFAWTRPVDLSYRQTEIHIEAAWNDATVPLFVGDANDYTWNWPAAGSYRAVVKHRDTAGNMSVTAASVDFVIGANIQSDYLTWVERGVTVQGRNLTKVGGVSAWDADAYTTDAFVGGAYTAVTLDSVSSHTMFGLNSDPSTDRFYSSIDYAAYIALGSLYYWKNNTTTGIPIAALAIGDKIAVSYDGANIRILHNGTVVLTDPILDTNPLHFDCSFNTPGATLSGVQFGPLTGIAGVTAAAAAAQTAANTANTAIIAITSDSVLSKGEKSAEILRKTQIDDEQAGIAAQGAAYGITTQRTNYNTAVSALTTYLGTLSPAWNDTTADTTIVASTYRTTWAEVYYRRQILLDRIAEVAGTQATWAGIPSGTGKADDYATRNVIYRQIGDPVSSPGGVVDGATWLELDAGGAVVINTYHRTGGVWVLGPTGPTGPAGYSNALVTIYKRSAALPAVPSVTTTYTFASGVSGLNNGWSATPQAGTDPQYVTVATASATGASDTIAPGEWAGPVVLVQDGTAGSNGLNSATVYLFQRTATSTAPALPSADITYTFSSGVATGITNGWTQSLAATGGAYRWVTTASALSSGTTDTITTSEWATAALLAQDGTDGVSAPSISLSRTSVNFSADSTGLIDAGQSFTSTVLVMLGAADDTVNWTLSVATSDASISGTRSGVVVTLDAMGTAVDAGTVTITATKVGFANQVGVISVGKIKRAVPAAGPVTSPGDFFAYDDAISPTDAHARTEFRRDGTIWTTDGGGIAQSGSWYLPNGASVGDNFQVRFEQIASTTSNVSTASGVWMDLSSTRAVSLINQINGFSFYQSTVGYSVRALAGGSSLCSGTIYMNSDVEV